MATIFTIRKGTSNYTTIADAELYLHQGSGSIQFGSGSGNAVTLLPLNAPVGGEINLIGNITASNAYFTNNVRIDGNIILGDGAAGDTIQSLGVFTTNLIPQGARNIGSVDTYWANLYATNISGAIAATNGVISGSSQVATLLPAGVISGSSQVVLRDTNGFSSYDSQISTITGSLIVSASAAKTTNDSQAVSITNLNTNSASVNTSVTNLNTNSASVNTSISNINSFTSSQLNQNSTLATYTASVQTRLTEIGIVSGSLISTASAHETRINVLASFTGSYATTGSNRFNGEQYISGNVYITGSIIPAETKLYDLGSPSHNFRDIYLSSSTIYMDNNAIFGATDVVPVNVGDYLEGGIVFYVDNVNGYSYLVYKDDIGEVSYSNFTRVAGASSSVLGGGIANTNAITASTGAEQNPAKICSDFTGGGYTDWYLPSTRELALIASNTNLMGESLAGVRYYRYWSSTADSNASKTYYAGDDSRNDNLFTNLGYGNTIMYSVPDNNASIGKVKAVRRTQRTTIIRTLSFPNFNFSGSINVAGTIDGVAVGAYVTQSNERITNLESSSANLNIVSASLNTFTASVNTSINNLNSTTASLNTSLLNVHSYTSSLKSAIDVTGGNLTVYGDLTVQGNTTTLNTSEVIIEDKTLTLASGSTTAASADGAGIQIAGANVTMSWNNTNQRIELNKDFAVTGIISSSTIIGLNGASVNVYSTSVDSRLSNIQSFTQSVDSKFLTLATTTGSINTSITNINSYTASVSTSVSNINSYTASVSTSVSNINSYTASVSTSVSNINSFTSSQNTKFSTLQTLTASYDGRFTTLGTYTGSVDGRFTTLGTYTGSVDGRFTTLGTLTSSYDGRWTTLATTTGSLQTSVSNINSYTASVSTSVSNINSTTASLNTSVTNLNSTTASLNTSVTNINLYTASVSTSISNLNSTTASLNTSVSNINTYTASVSTSISNLNSTTASLNISVTNLNLYTASVSTSISNLNDATASLFTSASLLTASFTALRSEFNYLTNSVDPGNVSAQFLNINDRFTTLGTLTGSYDSRWVTLATTTGSLQTSVTNINTYTASVSTSVGNINATTASLNTSVSSLNTFTASVSTASLVTSITNLNSFTGSQLTQNTNLATITGSLISSASADRVSITNINTTTASLNTSVTNLNLFTASVSTASLVTSINNLNSTTASLNTSVTNLNSYTSSLNTAIGISGADLTIKGNLTVQGSQSVINSVTVNIGDNIIELNYGGSATTAGIYTKDATGGSTVSGSLLWDASNDIWIAGKSGSEAKVLTDGMGIISGSGQLPNGVVSGSSQIILQNTTGFSAYDSALSTITGSLISSASADRVSITNINTTTASLNTSVSNLNSFTASVSTASLVTSITNLNSFTSSQLTQNSNLATYTGSVDGRFNTLGTYTSSLETRMSAVSTATASLALSASTALTTNNTQDVSISNLNAASSSYETKGRGIVSGSSQIVPLLPAGTLSGSAQLTTEFDSRYLNTGGDGIFSSSVQIGNYVATITGTSNQVVVAGSGNNAAAVTLSLPQSIATTSDVQFNNITASAGIRATGDIIAYYSSDERLKENINPIPNALSKVELISGNTYDWKEGFDNIHPHKGNDVGVIAQEIEKVLPQVVINRDNGYKAVDYEKIVPLLIEAIKELSAKVKELERK